ncbi:hypothetical protein RCL1_000502 [Eukaryota sp. TZLM3-RCL]
MTTHDTDSLNNCHLDTQPDEIRCVFLSIETVRYSYAYRESFKQPTVLPTKISPHSDDDEEIISALEVPKNNFELDAVILIILTVQHNGSNDSAVFLLKGNESLI